MQLCSVVHISFNVLLNIPLLCTAFLSIFQLLTLEDWEKVLANLVAATNWGSAIYVLAWIVIGVNPSGASAVRKPNFQLLFPGVRG